jgi:hypothetical protein
VAVNSQAVTSPVGKVRPISGLFDNLAGGIVHIPQKIPRPGRSFRRQMGFQDNIVDLFKFAGRLAKMEGPGTVRVVTFQAAPKIDKEPLPLFYPGLPGYVVGHRPVGPNGHNGAVGRYPDTAKFGGKLFTKLGFRFAQPVSAPADDGGQGLVR